MNLSTVAKWKQLRFAPCGPVSKRNKAQRPWRRCLWHLSQSLCCSKNHQESLFLHRYRLVFDDNIVLPTETVTKKSENKTIMDFNAIFVIQIRAKYAFNFALRTAWFSSISMEEAISFLIFSSISALVARGFGRPGWFRFVWDEGEGESMHPLSKLRLCDPSRSNTKES